jgi:hypothetical protein
VPRDFDLYGDRVKGRSIELRPEIGARELPVVVNAPLEREAACIHRRASLRIVSRPLGLVACLVCSPEPIPI